MEKQEIVFEDLHGTPELENVMVDLDVEDNAKGITRVADDEKERKRGEDTNGQHPHEDELPEGEEPPLSGREDDEDDDQYSRNVKKRIDRERRLRKKSEDDTRYWKEQAEAAQRQLSESRKSTSKEVLEALDGQITAAEKELEDAIENGKSADQVRLTSKLTDLKAKRITTELAGQADGGSDKPSGSDKVRPSGGVNPLAKRWMDEQSEWYGRPGFERHSRMANRIDTELDAEGYDARDPEYYKELTRRMRKASPELFDSDRDDDRRPSDRGRRERSPVAPVDRGGGDRPAGRSSRVELNGEDFSNMRNFGLDPNNPAHLKEYAANKRESDAQERQRSGGRS